MYEKNIAFSFKICYNVCEFVFFNMVNLLEHERENKVFLKVEL